jgi:hypothetical protein
MCGAVELDESFTKFTVVGKKFGRSDAAVSNKHLFSTLHFDIRVSQKNVNYSKLKVTYLGYNVEISAKL